MQTTRHRLAVSVLCTGLALLAFAAGADSGDAAARAEAFFQAGEWEKAAEAYATLTQEQPADGQAWFRLGFSRYRLERDTEALAAYQRALKNGFKTPYLLATAAVAHHRLGDRETAMSRLQDAVEAGLPASALEQNPAFAFAKSEQGFTSLLARAEELTYPCRNDPRARQLDFWVGDWKVSAGGNPAGQNSITRQHEGCLIHESYSTPGGYSGESLNFFDQSTGKWRQIWVDSGGNVIWYGGELVDGEMRLEGKSVKFDGTESRSRMTFTPGSDGSVRQLMEQSTDGGKTWTVAFDGHYVKQ